MRNYSRPLPREAREGQEGEGEAAAGIGGHHAFAVDDHRAEHEEADQDGRAGDDADADAGRPPVRFLRRTYECTGFLLGASF